MLKKMLMPVGFVKMLEPHEKAISEAEMVTRNKYRVSAVSKRKIAAGEVLTEADIEYKNPGTGIAPRDISAFLGKKINKAVGGDSLLTPDMFS